MPNKKISLAGESRISTGSVGGFEWRSDKSGFRRSRNEPQ